jgi:AhpD family alkylhydroperoxidase
MQERMRNPALIIPDVLEPLQALGRITAKAAPDRVLGLVHLRISQMNGCAACLEMHVRSSRKLDETPERMYTVAAWRESPFFTPQERAALALAEATTRLGDGGVPDDVWNEAARHFDEPTLAALVLHIGVVNLYNRLNVATKQVAGAHKWG